MVINGIMCTSEILTDFFFAKQNKTKKKKYFCKSCLWCFSSENVLTKHKEDSVRLEKGAIEFKHYF